MISFVLSSMDVTVTPLDPVIPVPRLGDAILEKLYNDEVHNDVLSIADTPSDMSTAAEGSYICSGTMPNTNMDTLMPIEYQQDSGMDSSNSNEGDDRVEPHA
ncbi:hypothetical protein CPC16_006191 [Podila verticillata]|nr:hypothetical protein CPC16_006191 [Podila verticillata]